MERTSIELFDSSIQADRLRRSSPLAARRAKPGDSAYREFTQERTAEQWPRCDHCHTEQETPTGWIHRGYVSSVRWITTPSGVSPVRALISESTPRLRISMDDRYLRVLRSGRNSGNSAPQKLRRSLREWINLPERPIREISGCSLDPAKRQPLDTRQIYPTSAAPTLVAAMGTLPGGLQKRRRPPGESPHRAAFCQARILVRQPRLRLSKLAGDAGQALPQRALNGGSYRSAHAAPEKRNSVCRPRPARSPRECRPGPLASQ
jgi:hypothetical protein